MTAEKDLQFGPKCNMCGRKDKIDEYHSGEWLLIDIKQHLSVNEPSLAFVCPDCIKNTRVYQELNEELFLVSQKLVATTMPNCIRCKEKMSPQDSRGWEKIIDNSDCVNNPEGSARIIWLCPNCIYKTQACKDFKEAVG